MSDPSVTFTLKLPAPEDGSLLHEMEENGIGRGIDFAAFALSDALVKMIADRAVAAMAGRKRASHRLAVFPDGTRINDAGRMVVRVNAVRESPHGLFGSTYTYDVTVSFPTASRYLPQKNSVRANPAATTDPARLDIIVTGQGRRRTLAVQKWRNDELVDSNDGLLSAMEPAFDLSRAASLDAMAQGSVYDMNLRGGDRITLHVATSGDPREVRSWRVDGNRRATPSRGGSR